MSIPPPGAAWDAAIDHLRAAHELMSKMEYDNGTHTTTLGERFRFHLEYMMAHVGHWQSTYMKTSNITPTITIEAPKDTQAAPMNPQHFTIGEAWGPAIFCPKYPDDCDWRVDIDGEMTIEGAIALAQQHINEAHS